MHKICSLVMHQLRVCTASVTFYYSSGGAGVIYSKTVCLSADFGSLHQEFNFNYLRANQAQYLELAGYNLHTADSRDHGEDSRMATCQLRRNNF